MAKPLPDHLNESVLCSVMSTVVYFDIFQHPLTRSEIAEYSHNATISAIELDNALSFLVEHSFLYEKDNYFLPNQKFENINRRVQGNALAKKSWPQAVKKSVLISKFPFVRSVVVSGSLSKGFMDEQSDIDFLIITQPGRLWLTRSMLAIYKKVFLLNSHKLFCVNYFLDLDNLALPDRNIFIATELLFAVPVYNPEVHYRFVEANNWSKSYYPSISKQSLDMAYELPGESSTKIMLEKLFNGKAGELLDKLLMRLTVRFWQKKFKTMKRTQYNRDMNSTEGVSKHHPNGFRDRVLEQHQQQMDDFNLKIKEALSAVHCF